MIGFPSGPKFIELNKQFRELKILTSTYKGSYQPMVNQNLINHSLNFDDTTFVIAA